MGILNFSYDHSLLDIMFGDKDITTRHLNPKRVRRLEEEGMEVYWKQGTPYGIKLFDAKLKYHHPVAFDENYEIYSTEGENLDIEFIYKHEGFDQYADYIKALDTIYGELQDDDFMLLCFRHELKLKRYRQILLSRLVDRIKQGEPLDKAQMQYLRKTNLVWCP